MEALPGGAWITLIAFIAVCSLTFVLALRNWVNLPSERTTRERTEEV
jgi:hypothetical protein